VNGSDSDGMMGSEGESDSSEEIHYGPGFVSRLKSRYMSVALRGSARGSIGTLRRSASLEDFLEIDKNRDEEIVELRQAPALVSQFNRHSAPVGVRPQQGSNSATAAKAKNKKKESMKRAQSVEVLSILTESPRLKRELVLPDSFFAASDAPPSESPPPLPPREKPDPPPISTPPSLPSKSPPINTPSLPSKSPPLNTPSLPSKAPPPKPASLPSKAPLSNPVLIKPSRPNVENGPVSSINTVLSSTPALVNDIVLDEKPVKDVPKPTPNESVPKYKPKLSTSSTGPKLSTSTGPKLPSSSLGPKLPASSLGPKLSSGPTGSHLQKRPSAGLLFGVKKNELPANDTVKETRKLFENGTVKSKSGGRTPLGLTKSKSTSSLYSKPASRSNSVEKTSAPTANRLSRKSSEENLHRATLTQNATRKAASTSSPAKRTNSTTNKPERSSSPLSSSNSHRGHSRSPIRKSSVGDRTGSSRLRNQSPQSSSSEDKKTNHSGSSSPSPRHSLTREPKPVIPTKPSHLSPQVNGKSSLSGPSLYKSSIVNKVTPTPLVPPPRSSLSSSSPSPPVTKSGPPKFPAHADNNNKFKDMSRLSNKNIQLNLQPLETHLQTSSELLNGHKVTPVSKVEDYVKASPLSSSEQKNGPAKQVGVIKPISRDLYSPDTNKPITIQNVFLNEQKSKTPALNVANLNKANSLNNTNNGVNNSNNTNNGSSNHVEKETIVIEKDVLPPLPSWRSNTQDKSKEAVGVERISTANQNSLGGQNSTPSTHKNSSPVTPNSPNSSPVIKLKDKSVIKSPPDIPPRNGSKLEHSDNKRHFDSNPVSSVNNIISPTPPIKFSSASTPPTTKFSGIKFSAPTDSAPKFIAPNISTPSSKITPSTVNKNPSASNGNKFQHKFFDSNITEVDVIPAAACDKDVDEGYKALNGENDMNKVNDRNGSYRDSWKQRQDQQNTLVFNFVNTKKDVSHIENDGLDMSKRTTKKGNKGVTLLEAGESNDADSDGIDDGENSVNSLNIVVIGANIKTGKSSIRIKGNTSTSTKKNISFNDKTEIFEYPSFESVNTVNTTEKDEKVEVPLNIINNMSQPTLKSNTPVGSLGGLGSYTPSKIQIAEEPFELGVSRTPVSSNSQVSADVPSLTSDPFLLPAPADQGLSWGSAASSDMLF